MSDFAALFDLDGVIIDSESSYTRFWADIDSRYPTGVEDFAKAIKGTNLASILKHWSDSSLIQRITDELHEFETHMEYTPYDGARQLLESLRAEGVATALVTSSDSVKMQLLYKRRPWIAELFDTIVTGSDVSRSKPDPEGYATAARRLGYDPSRCIVVEDSLQGIEAGRRAGAMVIGIATTNPEDTLDADLVLPHIGHLSYLLMSQLIGSL